MLIPKLLKEFNSVFENNGFKAYLVGGAVRDIFLNKKETDWDVATNATPQDVMRIFKFVVPTGFEHGTVTVHFKKQEIEVTTFRTESGYSDGRHPDKVNYAATIEEDLSRRDFTMNAIAVNLKDGSVVDPFDGKGDIKRRLIRTVGNPHERFMEDGLRPIRALRFASQLEFKIDEATFKEIANQDVQKKIQSISIERFRDEFEKIMRSPLPSVGLKLMEETKVLDFFIPELLECKNCLQSDYRDLHKFDVLNHLYYACDGGPQDKLNVRIAALFHDIGKPKAKKIVKQLVLDGEKKDGSKKEIETITFYNHEKYSAEIAEEILVRLKFPNQFINNVCLLIREHMFHYESNWSDAAVRRFIMRAGYENLEDLYDLRLADIFGMRNEKVNLLYSQNIELLLELKKRIAEIMENQNALSLKALAVNGKDLIAMGIKPGKQLGTILQHLLDCVIEDPTLNNKDRLLEIVKKMDK